MKGMLRRVPMFFLITGSLLCVIFLMLSTGCYAENDKDNLSLLLYMWKGGNTVSALILWHNVLGYGAVCGWLLLLAPLFCALPFVYAFCVEMSSGCYLFSMHRQGKKKFIFSRFFGAGLASAVCMLSALLVTFFIALFYSRKLGEYSYAPVCEMLFHRQSVFLAFAEVCVTYACYAFFLGILCVTLAACTLNAFTSCSAWVLALFLMGDARSSYQSGFHKSLWLGEVTMEEYNYFTDFLYVGNLAHGMPDFERNFGVSYWVYLAAVLALVAALYVLFYKVMERRVIL